MSVSKLLTSSGANDFNVTVSDVYTSVTFTKEYAAGAYTISSSLSDTTYDIYAINASGTVVAYTNSPSMTASGGFNKLVILGQTANNLLSFTYKTTYTSANTTAEVGAGPVITSASPTDLPNVGSTTVVTGRNFATGVQFYFSNGSYTSTIAPTVVRSSATSATVTRPASLPNGTYTLTATNPGVTAPTGSSSHILSNGLTAGNAPSWSTSATLPAYTKNVSYSQTVTATDSSDSGSTVTYSTVSSSLPSGLSITGSGNVISGTPTVLTSGSVTLRATDSGGNYVDRTFTIANVGANAPTWTTTSLTNASNGVAYSATLVVTDDSGSAPTLTVATGTLPTGITISGLVLSGTCSTDGTYSFTLRATDANGSYTDQAFTLAVITVGAWTTIATTTLPSSVCDTQGGYYNGFLYQGGGEGITGTGWPTTWYKANVSTGAVTSLASMVHPTDETGGIWCAGKFYNVVGYNNNGTGTPSTWDTIQIYNDATNTWSSSPSVPGGATGTTRVGTDGTNVYWMQTGSTSMYRYNVSSNTFTTLASNTASSWSQGFRMPYYGGVFYAICSQGGSTWVVSKYNVAGNSWSYSTTPILKTYGTTNWTGGTNYQFGCDVNANGTYLYIYSWDHLNAETTNTTRSIGTNPNPILRYNISADTWGQVYTDAGGSGGATGTDGNNAFYRMGGRVYNTSGTFVDAYALKRIYLP